jgi:diguanylate cyclase (GGDEF)-like protein
MSQPSPANDRRRFRLGLASRLALGFAAIAVVLLYGHEMAQRDLREAIETLNETQSAQVPLARVADALTYRVADFDRAVLAEVRRPTEASRQLVAKAEQELLSTLDTYGSLQPAAQPEIQRFLGEAREHTQVGWSLIEIGATRQEALAELRDVLDALTARVSKAFDLDAQLPDPAYSRRAYADLELSLGRLRTSFNGYLVNPSGDTDAPLRQSIARLRSTLEAHRDGLSRAPGRVWIELVEEDLDRVAELRQKLAGQDEQIEQLRGQFTESGLQLPLRLDAALAAPVSRAVARSANSAADATSSADRAIRHLTFLVLGVTLVVSLVTMLGVTRPVRRLTRATHLLARGEHDVRVPPGGARELDELGAAFNQMAVQLAEADKEVARHQRLLEGRVRARTRKLTHLANHDPLTGLPNRRYAFNHLRRAARAVGRRGGTLGLIALDIDNFKVINDNFGHSVGDSLLRSVADRLKLLAGGDRFIARLGGDEFVVELERSGTEEQTRELATRIVNGFRAPLNLGGREILVSVSVGVAWLPEHADDAASLVRAADAALFRAKELGRNRVATFSPSLLEGSEARFVLEQALRRAIEANELSLAFQPQVRITDGSTTAVEALLRWHRPGQETVSASEFIAIAEQSGLIMEIGEWALQTAAAAVAAWRRQGFEDARVAVNVSVHQLLDSRFVERLDEMLERHALPAGAIELELTETAFQTSSSTIDVLRQVGEGGLDLVLDDFGTGYSSLNSLSRLPLRRVKLDRSLVADAPEDRRTESLARSIIDVCHSLGLGVTIEGIERRDQLAWLLDCGPVDIQGFLVARPMPAEDIPQFARTSAARLEALLAESTLAGGKPRGQDPGVVPFDRGRAKARRKRAD